MLLYSYEHVTIIVCSINPFIVNGIQLNKNISIICCNQDILQNLCAIMPYYEKRLWANFEE